MKYVNFIFFLMMFICYYSLNVSAKMTDKIKIAHVKNDFSIQELDNKFWEKANDILIGTYWSGENAPVGRHFKAKLLWSDSALYVRFEANQIEPLVVSEKANLKTKTRGLWDRDVCEIFLAPDRANARKYFEFEIAPNGEWIDLGIYQKPDERIIDWNYNSGMQSAARIEKDKVIMALRVEWKAFGATPKAGDVWLGNILRCVGREPTRGYLAWQPTRTKEPSFHVPEAFGNFQFSK
jgi:hypothetical protein